ncbi:hypothetical protein BAE44_0025348 [Dichanthelium oligosanthes]|uniref:Uncharacterized protein n=1 Tax=Dichanthelium oligosanthes TaxID=888268 RepID=A0A1E5UL87_9POAL|nr:hypothetical protein BAE44_0025348 [Dichanthelium oligosanthes]
MPCARYGPRIVHSPCFCCQKPPQQVCYESLEECQSKCPICNPQCPLQSSLELEKEGRSSLVKTNGTLLK